MAATFFAETFTAFLAGTAFLATAFFAGAFGATASGEPLAAVANLASFLETVHPGPLQMVCGVNEPHDSALSAVAALRAAHPEARLRVVYERIAIQLVSICPSYARARSNR